MKILRISLLLGVSFSILIMGVSFGQNIEEYWVNGVQLGAVGKFDEARQMFKKILVADQFQWPAKFALEVIEDVYRQKIKKEYAIHLFNGIAQANKGNLDQAITAIKKAISTEPTYASGYVGLGGAYSKKGMLDEAIIEYKNAIRFNPQHAVAYFNLGVAYHKKGMRDEAISEYKKSIAINPNLANAYSQIGSIYLKREMLDEAVSYLRKATDINPNDAHAHYNLAVAYYGKREYKLAIKHCDKAIELGYSVKPQLLELLKPYRRQMNR